jgi:molecular chaperone DnaK (HSP70)
MGIDLGTTYSCIAVYRNGRAEVIPNDMGKMITPSMVCFKDGERLVGEQAKIHQFSYTNQTIYDSKRLIGRQIDEEQVQKDIQYWPFTVVEGDKKVPKIQVEENGKNVEFFPEQISSMILRKLAGFAKAKCPGITNKAVITVPAYFNNSQREATKLAGKIAGLDVIGIINEPTAAAIAYGFQERGVNKNILVYDLGGGTLDVTILKVHKKGEKIDFDVLATKGNLHLGGEDFDQTLLDYVINKLKNKLNFTRNGKLKEIVRRACEETKKRLSSVRVADISFRYNDTDYKIPITKEEFQMRCDDVISECTEPIQDALDQAGLDIGDINDVILVGGSTRIPMIQTMVKDFFDGKKPFFGLNPDEAVAQGAAIYAQKICGENEDDDDGEGGYISLIEVSDMVTFPIGTTLIGNRFSTIIKEKSKIPGVWTGTFFTAHDNQTRMLNEIREGFSEVASENHLLDKFTITDIPPGPAGSQKVIDKYEIDNSGILKVTSTVVSNGITKSLTIQRASYQHTESEIAAMKADCERYIQREKEITEKAAKLDEIETYVYSKIKETTNAIRRSKLDNLLISVKEWISINRNVSLEEIARKFNEVKKKADSL